MIKKVILFGIPVGLLAIMAFMPRGEAPDAAISRDTPLQEVLIKLGDSIPGHYLDNITPEMVKRGSEIVNIGRTTAPDGSTTEWQSKYFACTNCHNTVREDPDLRLSDPEARLEYAREKNIPFLQGTTFYGTVNRRSWYNGDYVLKYGEWVYPANKSLKEAIHLCATVCSQGRDLVGWEMDAVLAYFWSLQYKLTDLDLDDAGINRITAALRGEASKTETLKWLKEKYLDYSPATFPHLPEDLKSGYPLQGNPTSGKEIYELSCQHCHRPLGPSFFILDNSKLTFKKLRRNLNKQSRFSIYYATRKGTYSFEGHAAYMPLYTEHRMSDQQVEDLRVFIELKAQ